MKRRRLKEMTQDEFRAWLLERVNVKDNGCWQWTERYNSKGYGRIGVDGKELLVHRLVYEMLVGNVSDGCFVLHRCDKPSCCNPEHLYAGTKQDNATDRSEAVRVGAPRYAQFYLSTENAHA